MEIMDNISNWFQPFLLNFNAIICAIVAVKIFMWRMAHRPENFISTCIIYLIIVACSAITIRTLTGEYVYADWAESVINLALSILAVTKSGDLFSQGSKKHENKSEGTGAD